MGLVHKVNIDLGVSSCDLTDASFIKQRPYSLYIKSLNFQLLLIRGYTFYEKFGYLPCIGNNLSKENIIGEVNKFNMTLRDRYFFLFTKKKKINKTTTNPLVLG